uniref:Proteasome 26S subunit, non-ATPase 8 n=1 Tax=Scleropages formosus TaxID=113540 RepID=A0A8C9VKU0_SCLFO
MAAALKDTVALYENLKSEWNKKNPSLNKCGDILSKLKISLLELNFLPTSGTKLTKQQLILARDVLEIGALWSILKKDIPSFERYMAQLKCYYFDYKYGELREDCMHLMWITSTFLFQYLMEGSYNKVFLAKGNIPAESYTFFIDILLDTIRDEIAGCIEKAYEQIQFNEATRVLFFSSSKKMTEYAKKRGWILNANGYYSFSSRQQRTEEATIPSTELAQQVIEYARQLEMIV